MAGTTAKRLKRSLRLGVFMMAGFAMTACTRMPAPQLEPNASGANAQTQRAAPTLFGVPATPKATAEQITDKEDDGFVNDLNFGLARSKNFEKELANSLTKPELYPPAFNALAALHETLAKEKDKFKIAATINTAYNLSAYYDEEKTRYQRDYEARQRKVDDGFVLDPLTLMRQGRGICGDVANGKALSLSRLLGSENVWLLVLNTYDFDKSLLDFHAVPVVKIEQGGQSGYYVLEDMQPHDPKSPSARMDSGDPEKAAVMTSMDVVQASSLLVKVESYLGSKVTGKGMTFPVLAIRPVGGAVTLLKNPLFDRIDPITWLEMKLNPPKPRELGSEDVVRVGLKNYRQDLIMSGVVVTDHLKKAGGDKKAEREKVLAAYREITAPKPDVPNSQNGFRVVFPVRGYD